MEVDEFIEHHGVKGMHWGVRNKESLRRGPSSDHKVANPLRKRPVHTLTNKQLKLANERANLEQNFQRLNPGVVKRGESHIKAIIAGVTLASSIATLANTPAGKVTIAAGKKAISSFFNINTKGIGVTK